MFFFFNDTATTEIYTLSLHDALPILRERGARICPFPVTLDEAASVLRPFAHTTNSRPAGGYAQAASEAPILEDRKSTRLNSSHANISYAVFCLKKKKNTQY